MRLLRCGAQSTLRLFSRSCSTRATTLVQHQEQLLTAAHEIPPERVRNFCIIAHVDHGKSTLADRMMELTGAIAGGGSKAQLLDSLAVERDRGAPLSRRSLLRRPEDSGGTS